MPDAFDSDVTNLMARALDQALIRLKTLGLVDGDAMAASAKLSQLILQAAGTGERNEENLILYAIGRFQAERTRPAADVGNVISGSAQPEQNSPLDP